MLCAEVQLPCLLLPPDTAYMLLWPQAATELTAGLWVVLSCLQDHLLAVKARLQANLDAAVEQENVEGNKRLQAKQARFV